MKKSRPKIIFRAGFYRLGEVAFFVVVPCDDAKLPERKYWKSKHDVLEAKDQGVGQGRETS